MRLAALTILLLTFAAFTALAAEDGWYFVTTSEDGNTTYSIKEGSGERGENKKGEQMTVAVGKTINEGQREVPTEVHSLVAGLVWSTPMAFQSSLPNIRAKLGVL